MTKISNRLYGFQKGKSTIQPMFFLKILQENMGEHKRDLHMVFVDLEKAFVTLPRDLVLSEEERSASEIYMCHQRHV